MAKSGQPLNTASPTICHASCPDQQCKLDTRTLSLFILFWLTVIVLTPIYIWTVILIIHWSTALPFMIIYVALKVQLFSLAIGCGMVPGAFFLKYWSHGTGKSILCLKSIASTRISKYSIVSILSIALATSSILLIDDYKQDSYVWNEYSNQIKVSLNKSEFPHWATDVFGTDCCGWDGPLDFGLTFNLTQFLKTGDKTVMDQVSKCYNELFEVTINPGTTIDDKLILGLNKHYQLKLPSGCRDEILNRTRKACYFIAFSSIVNIILTALNLLVYLIPCWKRNRSRISPTIHIKSHSPMDKILKYIPNTN